MMRSNKRSLSPNPLWYGFDMFRTSTPWRTWAPRLSSSQRLAAPFCPYFCNTSSAPQRNRYSTTLDNWISVNAHGLGLRVYWKQIVYPMSTTPNCLQKWTEIKKERDEAVEEIRFTSRIKRCSDDVVSCPKCSCKSQWEWEIPLPHQKDQLIIWVLWNTLKSECNFPFDLPWMDTLLPKKTWMQHHFSHFSGRTPAKIGRHIYNSCFTTTLNRSAGKIHDKRNREKALAKNTQATGWRHFQTKKKKALLQK